MYLEGNYNFYAVALSIIIAILASYSTLNITGKISEAIGKVKFFWLISGSVVLGSGIWSMHFIGMMAFELPLSMDYHIGLTLISVLASTGASFIALYVTMPKKIHTFNIVLGGFFIGSGILAMHYTGMEAMIMPASLSYDIPLVILSMAIAYLVSYAALFLFLRFRDQSSPGWVKWVSAILMGSAICGMHYTGMEASRFYVADTEIIGHSETHDSFLLYGVTAMIFIIILITWGAMFFERHAYEKMAFHDALTNLPNRHHMKQFFDKHLNEGEIGVLYIDLDQFKPVNDTLGHHVGDELLKEFSMRLRPFTGSSQKVFRIGGDEFLFIIKNGDLEKAEQLAKEILRNNKKPYHIDGHELYVAASIGISVGPVDELDASTLLNNADKAMYKAKNSGTNQYIVYDCKMINKDQQQIQLEKDLWNAITNQELSIVYQPKLHVTKNHVSGFEALLRWNHPRLGAVSPELFIPIAEQNGFIVPMTHWVLEKMSRQCKRWEAEGISQSVSIKLSNQLFQSGNLLEHVQCVLKEAELEPNLLELEIKESMIVQNVKDINPQIQAIRDLGVKITMVDFGMGKSSIGLLDQIHIDALKLNQAFLENIETPRKRAIVGAMILMAENLGIEVIAEDVVNEMQVETLEKLGCKVIQGDYYSKPMGEEEIDDWINDYRKTTV